MKTQRIYPIVSKSPLKDEVTVEFLCSKAFHLKTGITTLMWRSPWKIGAKSTARRCIAKTSWRGLLQTIENTKRNSASFGIAKSDDCEMKTKTGSDFLSGSDLFPS